MRIKSSNKIIRLLIEIERDVYLSTKAIRIKIEEIITAIGDLIFRPAPVPRNLKNNIFLSLLIKAIWLLLHILLWPLFLITGILLIGLPYALFTLIFSLLGLHNGITIFISFILWLFVLNRYIFDTGDISIH